MDAFDVYSQQMFRLNKGHALYEPDPAGRDIVRIGDVGYISRGAFHRAFNIFSGAEGPINNLGVPEHFEPCPSQFDGTFYRAPLNPGLMYTHCVSERGVAIRVSAYTCVSIGTKVELECKDHQGAALIIKYPAYREDTCCVLSIGRYMLKHYRTWLTFIRDVLGVYVELADLVLVTGCDLAADWATVASVENSVDASVTFEVSDPTVGSVDASFWGSWHTTFNIPHRSGPSLPIRPTQAIQSDAATWPRSKSLPENNQCIFIRSLRVKERPLFLPPRLIQAGAGCLLYKKHDDPDLGPSVYAEHTQTVHDDAEPAVEILPARARTIHEMCLDNILQKKDVDVTIIHDDVSAIMTPEVLDAEDPEPCLAPQGPRVTIENDEASGKTIGRLEMRTSADPSEVIDYFDIPLTWSETATSGTMPLTPNETISAETLARRNFAPEVGEQIKGWFSAVISPEFTSVPSRRPGNALWSSIDVLSPERDGLGPFIPQNLHQPHTSRAIRRYVEEVKLELPIVFQLNKPTAIGIPLRDALNRRFGRLEGRNDLMFLSHGPSVSIRLQWAGYQPWCRQIPTRDFRISSSPITHSNLARNVAASVESFLQDYAERPMGPDSDPRWRVGPKFITLDDLILVSLHHVSMGSWQANLRLRDRPAWWDSDGGKAKSEYTEDALPQIHQIPSRCPLQFETQLVNSGWDVFKRRVISERHPGVNPTIDPNLRYFPNTEAMFEYREDSPISNPYHSAGLRS